MSQEHMPKWPFLNLASNHFILISYLLIDQMNILRAILFSTFLRMSEVSEHPRYTAGSTRCAGGVLPKTSGTLFSMKRNKYVYGRGIHIFSDQVGPKISGSVYFLSKFFFSYGTLDGITIYGVHSLTRWQKINLFWRLGLTIVLIRHYER